MKTSTLSADNFKKILDLDGSTPEPAIRSSDTGQRIPCFDSCQLITTKGGGELGSLFVRMILAIVTSRREKRATSRIFRCHFQILLLKLVFLDIDASKWFLSEWDSAIPTSLSEKVSEMYINLKNNAHESCKQF